MTNTHAVNAPSSKESARADEYKDEARAASNREHLRDARTALIQAHYEGGRDVSSNQLGFTACNSDWMQEQLVWIIEQIDALIDERSYRA